MRKFFINGGFVLFMAGSLLLINGMAFHLSLPYGAIATAENVLALHRMLVSLIGGALCIVVSALAFSTVYITDRIDRQ
ncbi:hypothetical protein [Brevundimonas diminuta]